MGSVVVLRNEPKDVNRAVEARTDDAAGSLRNEPNVISKVVAIGGGDGDAEDEVVRSKRGVVRSVRVADKLVRSCGFGLTGVQEQGERSRGLLKEGYTYIVDADLNSQSARAEPGSGTSLRQFDPFRGAGKSSQIVRLKPDLLEEIVVNG